MQLPLMYMVAYIRFVHYIPGIATRGDHHMSGTELELPETMRLEEAPGGDAPPAETTETERPKSPHQSAMERIAEKYEQQQLAAEIATGEEITRQSPPIGDQGDGDAESVRPTHREPSQQPAAHQPELRTVTIQGQQFQVTEDQYARLAEQGAMANIALSQHRPQMPVQPQAAPQYVQPQRAPQQPVSLVDDATAREVLRRIQYGDEQEGAAALGYLINTAAAQAAGVAQQTVYAHAAHQAQASELNRNLEVIGREFPEIFNDEVLAASAALHLTKLRQRDVATGTQRDNLDLYREACRATRASVQRAAGVDGRQDGDVRVSNDRYERKRNAPRNPMAVSRAAGLGPAPSRGPSNAEIIDQMRVSRGQAPIR